MFCDFLHLTIDGEAGRCGCKRSVFDLAKMSHKLFFLVSMTLAYTIVGQDVLYPTTEETDAYLSGNNPVITERIPVYIPGRCSKNMLLYPGAGDKSTWMCDCSPGFLYFPLNDTCHEAYTQGPCSPGNFVYLPQGEAIPICKENPCSQSGHVPFNGKCYALECSTNSPCDQGFSFRVNRTTFQLECIDTSISATTIPNTPKIRKN